MNQPIRDLLRAAKSAARWMRDATPPGELNKPLRALEAAIKNAEQEKRNRKTRNNAQATVQ